MSSAPGPLAQDAATTSAPRQVEVAVIGGGQAGLATAFYLRRAGLVPGAELLVLDAAVQPGGAWPTPSSATRPATTW